MHYGPLPAFTSETAGQLTHGTAAEPPRGIGAILAAGPSAWRDLARRRGAPVLTEPLTESEPSAAEQLAARRRVQLEVNQAAGAKFEGQTATDLEREGANFARQITVETESGLQTRLDFVSRDLGMEKIRLLECKGSKTARQTPNQKKDSKNRKRVPDSGASQVWGWFRPRR